VIAVGYGFARMLLNEMVPVPDWGRRFTAQRPVRLADATPGGRIRLDAVARYLQDVANDDATEADLPDAMAWVVRRTAIQVDRWARLGERLELVTFCSGVGASWAERRTAIRGDRGAHIEAAALWVHVDAASGRPRRLGTEFERVYGETHRGRRVSARLRGVERSGALPGGPGAAGGHGGEDRDRDFPLRLVDFDVLGHVNNTVYWAMVEEVLAVHRPLPGGLEAEVEHQRALDRASAPVVRVSHSAPDRMELCVSDQAGVSAMGFLVGFESGSTS
jgi:acyl-ACP thioesterase